MLYRYLCNNNIISICFHHSLLFCERSLLNYAVFFFISCIINIIYSAYGSSRLIVLCVKRGVILIQSFESLSSISGVYIVFCSFDVAVRDL